MKSPESRKWLIFASVFAVWLVADLWSKHWADTRLANPSHPLVARVQAGDEGRNLRDFAAARFDLPAAEVSSALAHIERMEPPVAMTPEAPIFDPADPSAKHRGFWVFWRGDKDLSPRRLDRALELSRVEGWLRFAAPTVSRERVTEAAREALASETFASWAGQVFRKLDGADVARLSAEDRIHPLPWASVSLGPDYPVKAGEVYLLTHRQVDVAGDWFKYVYAENPGAAFGFMKGIAPGLRHTLFMILSLIAFVVILSITRKLPPTSRVILIAFSGILSGAVGNFIDRIRYGFVIDFIDMDLGFMHWPTYNIADIAISLGVIVLVIDLTFNRKSVLASPKKPAEVPSEA